VKSLCHPCSDLIISKKVIAVTSEIHILDIGIWKFIYKFNLE